MGRPFLYSRSTWRGKFVDMWTIPHLISGVVIAYLAFIQHIEHSTAFWVALCVGVGWELMERITGLSRTEAYANSLSDIIAAQVGFVAGWWLWMYVQDETQMTLILLVMCALFGAISLLGYRAFKYYG